MIHSEDGKTSLKQVEFNTISSSFGGLSTVVCSLHQQVPFTDQSSFAVHSADLYKLLLRHLRRTTSYFGKFDALNQAELPENKALTSLCDGLAEAHRVYGSTNAAILMVVQDGERNVFDQRFLEYELLQRYVRYPGGWTLL